ncbi:zinc finger BED domain-containing protein 4-like [Rhinatrema bivittatum]|uniref:zinc finger BED domain-containing protein 4-like n=1 Tax=Rhinatrema bivittatum TaxID=194408 RepID=UPI0011278450|nr:zinc finger BED domain-containing protein 4-like [Rhinatrema bivittatum]
MPRGSSRHGRGRGEKYGSTVGIDSSGISSTPPTKIKHLFYGSRKTAADLNAAVPSGRDERGLDDESEQQTKTISVPDQQHPFSCSVGTIWGQKEPELQASSSGIVGQQLKPVHHSIFFESGQSLPKLFQSEDEDDVSELRRIGGEISTMGIEEGLDGVVSLMSNEQANIGLTYTTVAKSTSQHESPSHIVHESMRDAPLPSQLSSMPAAPMDFLAAPTDPLRGSRKRSQVWRHFRPLEDQRFAECLHCKKTVSRGRIVGHLTNTLMQYHLKKQHLAVLLAGEVGTLGTLTTSSSSSKCTGKGRSISQPKLLAPSPRDVVGEQPLPLPKRQAAMELMGYCPTALTWSKRQAVCQMITRYIGEMVALDDQPLQVVENVGFKRLLHLLAPNYKVPNCATFIRHVIPTLYAQCRSQMQAQLTKAEGNSIHFTTNIWTSQNAMHAFLSLTAHWWQLDEARAGGSSRGCPSAGYKWALLHAQVMNHSHTSDHILEAIRGTMEGWLVRDLSKGFIVTDSDSKIIRAMGDGAYKGIRCFAHLLNLVVKDALGLVSKNGSSIVLRDLIERCRKIACYFNHSVKGGQQLRQKQVLVGAPLHNLIQDVGTRWNSTYLMLQRLLEQQTPLHELSLEAEIGLDCPLGCQDWLHMTQVVYVLKPFKEAMEALSLGMATLGEVIPIVNLLEQKLEGFRQEQGMAEEVMVLVECLQLQFQNRLKPLTQLDCYMLATICDPRIKGSIAVQSNSLCYWKKKLVARVQECQWKRQRASAGERVGSPCSNVSIISTPLDTTYSPYLGHPPPLATAGWALLTQAIASVADSRGFRQQSPEETLAETLVRLYLAEPIEIMTTDPLAYWAHKAEVWPDLAKVAQHFLSCPPTSVLSERIFSIVGDIVSPCYSWQAPELVEQLVFIKINLPLLGFPEFQCEFQEG